MTGTTPFIALSDSALDHIGGTITLPDYDRGKLQPSVVHFGVGGFHRAHLATYIDELARAGHVAWGIVGCGVLEGDAAMAAALKAQDRLYSLITRSAAATSIQVIGSIVEYIHAWPDPTAAIDQIADPRTQIVSLTVTEGGYPVDDLTGEFVPDSPNAAANSAFGVIASGLERRRQLGGSPLTVLSCDNIMTNGAVTRAATLGCAAAHGAALTTWINESVSFPNSMVDRITPATSDADRTWLRDTHQLDDQWPVVTEPFRQWVVEDNFAGQRLPLEQLDVIVTDDVEPYEFMKLRLLNASHSCLAYLAALDGIETVDIAMADATISGYVRAFLDIESKPVLPEVAGIDVDAYNETLIERFSNPAIGDQISRLCLDGSAKFPKFLMPTVRAQLAAEGPISLAALALAGWCQYLVGTTDHGAPIEWANDPQLTAAKAYAQSSLHDPAAFLDFEVVFGIDVANNQTFRDEFVRLLHALRTGGMRAAIAAAHDGIVTGVGSGQ